MVWGRASLRGVLKRLSEPSCETVQRLGVGCPAAGVLRRWRAVHHDRVDVFLPVLEPTVWPMSRVSSISFASFAKVDIVF